MEIATLIPIIIIILLIQNIIWFMFFDTKFCKIQDEIRDIKKEMINDNHKNWMKRNEETYELKDFIRNITGSNK